MRALMTVLALGGMCSSAFAAKEQVLVLELEAKGLPAPVVATLEEGMRDEAKASLGAKGNVMPKPALDFDAMKLAAGCVEDGPECLAVIGRTLGASRVLQTVISGNVQRAKVTFTLLDVASGKPKVTAVEMSDIDKDSAAELRVHIAALFGVKKKPPNGAIVLVTGSKIGKLEGAEVLLDDKKVAPAQLADVAPGRHRIEVRQKGFETFIWTGAVNAGKKTQIPVSFEPTRGPDAPPLVAVAPPPAAPAPAQEPEAAADTPAIPRAGEPAEPAAAPMSAPPVEQIPPPAPAAREDRGGLLFTWILGGAAIVAATVGTVQGVRFLGQNDDVVQAQRRSDDMCVGPTCPSVCDDGQPDKSLCDGARTTGAIATGAWIAAGALAAGSAIALVIESSSSSTPHGTVAPHGFTAGVAPTPDGAAVSFGFSF